MPDKLRITTARLAPTQHDNREPDAENREEHNRDELNVLINIFALLTNLWYLLPVYFILTRSELSTYAMHRLVNEGLFAGILSWIKPSVGNKDTAVAAAELLNVLTEDFEPIRSQLTDDGLLLFKMTLANQKQSLRLRSTVASMC